MPAPKQAANGFMALPAESKPAESISAGSTPYLMMGGSQEAQTPPQSGTEAMATGTAIMGAGFIKAMYPFDQMIFEALGVGPRTAIAHAETEHPIMTSLVAAPLMMAGPTPTNVAGRLAGAAVGAGGALLRGGENVATAAKVGFQAPGIFAAGAGLAGLELLPGGDPSRIPYIAGTSMLLSGGVNAVRFVLDRVAPVSLGDLADTARRSVQLKQIKLAGGPAAVAQLERLQSETATLMNQANSTAYQSADEMLASHDKVIGHLKRIFGADLGAARDALLQTGDPALSVGDTFVKLRDLLDSKHLLDANSNLSKGVAAEATKLGIGPQVLEVYKQLRSIPTTGGDVPTAMMPLSEYTLMQQKLGRSIGNWDESSFDRMVYTTLKDNLKTQNPEAWSIADRYSQGLIRIHNYDSLFNKSDRGTATGVVRRLFQPGRLPTSQSEQLPATLAAPGGDTNVRSPEQTVATEGAQTIPKGAPGGDVYREWVKRKAALAEATDLLSFEGSRDVFGRSVLANAQKVETAINANQLEAHFAKKTPLAVLEELAVRSDADVMNPAMDAFLGRNPLVRDAVTQYQDLKRASRLFGSVRTALKDYKEFAAETTGKLQATIRPGAATMLLRDPKVVEAWMHNRAMNWPTFIAHLDNARTAWKALGGAQNSVVRQVLKPMLGGADWESIARGIAQIGGNMDRLETLDKTLASGQQVEREATMMLQKPARDAAIKVQQNQFEELQQLFGPTPQPTAGPAHKFGTGFKDEFAPTEEP